jgi:hypothetical protein
MKGIKNPMIGNYLMETYYLSRVTSVLFIKITSDWP